MPSVEEMQGVYGRLLAELRARSLDHHRLLEIETIVRLLVPHLTRALVEAMQRDGESDRLREGSRCLSTVRGVLTEIENRRERELSRTIQDRLIVASEAIGTMLRILEAS